VSEPRPGTGAFAPPEIAFAEVVKMIDTARQHAYQAVNTTLIELYWKVGAYISAKLEAAEWGDGVVDQLARHLAISQPGLRGFTRRNLFRMRQFYDTYREDEKVSALLTQLPWTHNLIILGQSKRAEEREFYLRNAIQEKWSSRELERQFKAALFERAIIEPVKASLALRQPHPAALDGFKDSYLVEFLDLAEYALSRTLSPAVIAKYGTQLPDKKLLRSSRGNSTRSTSPIRRSHDPVARIRSGLR
jgi:predicted nuclease of restriction endonuclease-like (RecB) superfamily